MLLKITGDQVGDHRFEMGFRKSRRTETFSYIDIVRDRIGMDARVARVLSRSGS